tara:strand:+ start:48 stop:356 length:309 start_codon:yes stop_codon:yes gene_type:complete
MLGSKDKEQDEIISIPREEFEAMLCRAAEKGALRALADVGLDGEDAAHDIKELRSLLSALQLAKRTAFQTFIKITTTAILFALIAGLAMKLKVLTLFGIEGK